MQNLYNCGKVCLSLLGTWQGNQGEGWNAVASSMLQVLYEMKVPELRAQQCHNYVVPSTESGGFIRPNGE